MKLLLRLTILTAALFVEVNLVTAQLSRMLWIKVDVGSEVDSMIFGDDINTTYGIDTGLGETAGPPGECDGCGWVMWEDPRGNGYVGSDGRTFGYLYLRDLRHYDCDRQVDTFQLSVIPQTGAHVGLTWPDSVYIKNHSCDSILMKDARTGGLVVNLNMMHQHTLTLSDSHINDLMIIVYWTTLVFAVPPINSAPPSSFALHQNYPNPFNPTTNLQFSIANFGFVSLKVYDELGKEVATLVNEVKQPGEYRVEWNPSTSSGQGIASSVYFVRMTADQFSSVRKVMMLK